MEKAKLQHWKWNAIRHFFGFLLAISLVTTASVFVAQNRWTEALPLHLCCVSAILAAVLAFVPMRPLLTFLWTLGAPGAALALLFPAPREPVFRLIVEATYFLTHALILAVTAMRLAEGMYPEQGGAVCFALLQVLGLAAFYVNQRLGTNYLFLGGPPAATRLSGLTQAGFFPYLLILEGGSLLVCAAMDVLTGRIWPKSGQRVSAGQSRANA